MDAGDDNQRISAAKHQPRQPARLLIEGAQAERDAIPQHPTRRADKEQRHEAGDDDGQERGEDQIQGVRNALAQLFLQVRHEPDRQQHREDGALIADHGHIQAEEVHGLEAARHAPGVGQGRVGQNAAECRPEVGVAAKLPRRGKADQDRQNDEGRRAEHVEHDEQRAVGIDPAVGAHHAEQPHQQTRGDDGWNDGDEDVGERPRQALGHVELGRRHVGQLRLAGGACAGQRHKLRIDLVDQASAEDHLNLTRVAEAPLDPVQLVDGGLVHLAVVRQHQPQPGGAVGGTDDVLTAPEQGHQILGYRTDIHIIPLMTRQLAGPCHMRLRAVELRF
ncbi:hypothetical protein D3C79_656510 [compost metagenome]